jgi:membrane protease YdiL (CAAX protease family)
MGPGFILWGIAPLLSAAIVRIVTRDWADFGIKPAFKKNIRWYIVAIVAFPVMTVLTFLLGQALSVSSFSGFALAPFLKTFVTALPIFIVFAIIEEFGWRGYLVPKLASLGLNSYLSYAIIAVVWATWHLPYFKELAWVYSAEALISFIPRFFLAMFAFAIFYGEIRRVTGSVWPAVLMHAVMNAFGHPLAADFVQIAPGKDYLVSSTGVFIIVFTGIAGVIINRWRVKREKILTT